MEESKPEDIQGTDTPLDMPERARKTLEGTPLESNLLTYIDRISNHARPLQEDETQFASLLAQVGDAHFVLIGEASHGTHEFYRARAEITRRLIEEKGFQAVAVEADWPDAYRVNRYVQSTGDGTNATDALADFQRFPLWMWRNTEVLSFVDWLHTHNQDLPVDERVGFYGLDLYSLSSSREAVIQYLDEVDPEAAQRARYRYSCFDHFGEDPQAYGYAASFSLTDTCEKEAVEQLVDLRRQAFERLNRDGFVAKDEFFFAEQNARVVRNAEKYYRSMFESGNLSWNLRDTHMMETLTALEEHLSSQGREAKIVVWAHNSHLGDARATELGRGGEINLGQLVRQRYGNESVLVGFTTYQGNVSAASGWGEPVEQKRVRPALVGSFEAMFHEVETPRFYLLLNGQEESLSDLRVERLERAIGVVYLPQTERISHYFHARLMDQFDAILHYDETTALEPLDMTPGWQTGEPPETYPSGM